MAHVCSLYTGSDAQAREAADVIHGLVEADELTAEIRVMRWHPVQEEWKDASIPLPRTAEEEDAEYAAREATEAGRGRGRRASTTGTWSSHAQGREQADRAGRAAQEEGLPVAQRWRYVVVGVLTEERAEELADRLRAELRDADVSVEANVEVPAFQFLSL